MAPPKKTKSPAKKTAKKAPIKKAASKKEAPKPVGAKQDLLMNPQYNPLTMLREFLHMEAAGGMILLFFAVLAMVLANSPLAHDYHHILHDTTVALKLGPLGLEKDLIHFINDGLMAIFFLLVGLEIKREMMEGSLSSIQQAMLPGVAAIGGMAIPGLVYAYFNWENPTAMTGWAVPTATDIAFAVGMIALLGKRVPLALKVFLLALAIFDDLGAILIIAFFYTSSLDVANLVMAGAFTAVLVGLNVLNVSRGSLYLIFGLALWFCVLKSGIHATLAGVIVAFTIPHHVPRERRSLLRQLEHDLHTSVAYFILPMFAFANAGVTIEHASFDILFQPVALGVIAGLVVGKQVGIFGATWLCVKAGLAKLPEGVNWTQVWGVSCLAGIGFTMSLFIATLGFQASPEYLTEAKLGILAGSTISAIAGLLLLKATCRKEVENA